MKKKQLLSSAFVWLKDVGLKAFAVLALVVGGFYVIAADINWPTSPPNPTTGVVGMFVGESKTAYTAALDYVTSGATCDGITAPDGQIVNGAHICTPDEIVNSYNHGTAGISAIFTYISSPTLWINSGPPGFTANANDCQGWKYDVTKAQDLSNPVFGTIWTFGAKKGNLLLCESGKKFACCK